jgi:hypothetical protein
MEIGFYLGDGVHLEAKKMQIDVTFNQSGHLDVSVLFVIQEENSLSIKSELDGALVNSLRDVFDPTVENKWDVRVQFEDPDLGFETRFLTLHKVF